LAINKKAKATRQTKRTTEKESSKEALFWRFKKLQKLLLLMPHHYKSIN